MKTCSMCQREGEVPDETPEEPKADIEQQQRLNIVMSLRAWANQPHPTPQRNRIAGMLLAASMIEANFFDPEKGKS